MTQVATFCRTVRTDLANDIACRSLFDEKESDIGVPTARSKSECGFSCICCAAQICPILQKEVHSIAVARVGGAKKRVKAILRSR